MNKYKNILNKFQSKKIAVVGDVILDRHIKGSVSRISPEAPVPIVLQESDPVLTPGGAANVACNLRSLGASVTLFGRIGQDPEGDDFLKCLKRCRISTSGIFVDRTTPTVIKTRIIAQHQQVLRLDREKLISLPDDLLQKRILGILSKHIKDYDAVIISDYGKGLITPALVSQVCALALNNRKIITVDPKVEHFGYYRGVTAITPNRKEAENAIRHIKITESHGRRLALNSDRLQTLSDVEKAGGQLLKYMGLESLLITLGEHGMYLFEKSRQPIHIPTKTQDVFDVTGAGDTVIAVFTLSLTAGADKRQAADLANSAAGLVVKQMGTATVTLKELAEAIQ